MRVPKQEFRKIYPKILSTALLVGLSIDFTSEFCGASFWYLRYGLAITIKKKQVSDKVQYFVPFGRFVRYGFVLFLLNIILAAGIVPAVNKYYQEYHFMFSGAKEMAGFIESNNLEDNTIVGHQSTHVSALAPCLPETKFWYAGIEDYGTFINWNSEWSNNHHISFEVLENRMNEHEFSGDATLILLNNPISDSEISDYQLLYEVKTDIFGYGNEIYYLYSQR